MTRRSSSSWRSAAPVRCTRVALAAETGIGTVLVPLRPGHRLGARASWSPISSTISPLTLVQRIDRIDVTALEASLDRLASQGREPLRREGVAEVAMRFERALDLRYVGQSYHLTIVLPNQPVTRELLDDARRRFNEAHFAAYGYAEPGEPCEVVNVRVSASGTIRSSAPDFDRSIASTVVEKDKRQVWFESAGFAPCAVYDRSALAKGASLDGPAVIEDRDATTLVHPGWRCSVVQHGALRIDRR